MGLLEKNGKKCDYCLVDLEKPWSTCCGFDLCPYDYIIHCESLHHNGPPGMVTADE